MILSDVPKRSPKLVSPDSLRQRSPVCLSCGKSMHRLFRLFHCFRQTVYPMHFIFDKNPARRYNINLEMKGNVLLSVRRVAFCPHDLKIRVAHVLNFLLTTIWLVRRLWMEDTVSSVSSETANAWCKRLSTWRLQCYAKYPKDSWTWTAYLAQFKIGGTYRTHEEMRNASKILVRTGCTHKTENNKRNNRPINKRHMWVSKEN